LGAAQAHATHRTTEPGLWRCAAANLASRGKIGIQEVTTMRGACVILFVVSLVGCASQGDKTPVRAALPTVPSYLTQNKGCAVVAGGGIGSTFADSKVTSFWHELNRQITDRVHELLVAGKYRSFKYIVPVEDTPRNEQLVIQSLVHHRCNRLIQLSHTINEDAAGRYFRFDVAVMRLAPRGASPADATGTSVVTVGDFSREYRYPRTTEAFDSFHAGRFAAAVFADLEKSGSLRPLR
jgi:hypothetical protein